MPLAKPCLLAPLLVAATLFGQGITGIVSPNPVPAGAPMALSICNGTGGLIYYSQCPQWSIRQGSPTGPVVLAPPCPPPPVPVPLNHGASANAGFVFTPFGLPSGSYFIDFLYANAQGAPVTETIAFSIEGMGSTPLATLRATNPARVGQHLNLQIDAGAVPGTGGAPYLVAASFSTNVGFFATPTQFCPLDLDFLLVMSIVNPDPLVFANFQGSLNPNGFRSGIALLLPNLPALANRPLHLQAAFQPAGGLPLLSSIENLCIAP